MFLTCTISNLFLLHIEILTHGKAESSENYIWKYNNEEKNEIIVFP